MLKYGPQYVDRSQDYYEAERRKRAASRRAAKLGYKPVPSPATTRPHQTTLRYRQLLGSLSKVNSSPSRYSKMKNTLLVAGLDS